MVHILLGSPTWILQLLYRWGGWGIQLFFVSRCSNPGSSRASQGLRSPEPELIKQQTISVLKSNELLENILWFWNSSDGINSTTRCAVTTLFPKWNVLLESVPWNPVVNEVASQSIFSTPSIHFSSYKPKWVLISI